MIAGDIYTIAGDGTQGTGDQAPAAQASFGNLGPDANAVTGSGAIMVAGGTRIREISGGRTRSLAGSVRMAAPRAALVAWPYSDEQQVRLKVGPGLSHWLPRAWRQHRSASCNRSCQLRCRRRSSCRKRR